MSKYEKEIMETMMEGIFIHRWNSDKSAIESVLTEKEIIEIYKNIREDLKKAGFEIIKVKNHATD